MNTQNGIVAITSLFIVGMIWLRTRMQYAQSGGGALRLTRAGLFYFCSGISLLIIGWIVAPPLGRAFWPGAAVTPTLMRVVWCLATYYVFIAVHRILKSRGTVVFLPREGPAA